MNRTPFIAWPGWAHVGYGVALGTAFTTWFSVIYGGASAITAMRALRVPIHTQAELALPLIPSMLVFYMSIYLLFLVEPFILRTRRALRALVGAQAVATLIGGACFLLIPSETAYPPPGDLGAWNALYALADRMNLDYNNVPSLHVTLGVLCIATFAASAQRSVKVLLWAWAAALSASTVLTHQHHLVDVPTGWLLAWLVHRFVYLPMSRDAPAPLAEPAHA